jgi:leucyl-tRNA synthetase
LDCFFDDAWSYLSCVPRLHEFTEFPGKHISKWMPVDHFHSGFDTFTYLNLYRFVGMFLSDIGVLSVGEPLRKYVGHDMIKSDGRKMSKSAANSVSARQVVDEYGADALRLAVLWAAAPERAIDWRHADLQRSTALGERIAATFSKATEQIFAGRAKQHQAVSKSVTAFVRRLRRSWPRIGKFIDEYRPNAAVEHLSDVVRTAEGFVSEHATSTRFSDNDASRLLTVFGEFSTVLSPFAPFLAEECAALTKLPSLAATSQWPTNGAD